MKKQHFLVCILCIFSFSICKGQDYRYIYYLDVNLASVEKSKAVIIGKGIKENGLFKLDCFSVTGNFLLLTYHFKDSTLAELEGPSISYHLNGKKEKQGNYVNGYEEGAWLEWDSLGRKKDSTIFKDGLPYITTTFGYHKNGSLSYYTIKDSIQNTLQSTTYDEHAAVSSEIFFIGQKGIIKTYTASGIKADSLFTREEKEASFPGGETGWRDYLRKNLNPNTPVDNGAPSGKYTVIIKFIVAIDGSLDEVFTETYHGYGMEQEVIRIIKNGPKWIPAVQYGLKVKAYRRQPVTFLVESGK